MDYIVKGLAHIGVMTEDAAGCAKFYIDNLSFRPFYEFHLGDMYLNFVECGGCVIEFIQKGTNTDDVNNDGIVDHIALEIQGIEVLVEELKLKGIEFETELIEKMPDFYPVGVKNIFFKGPAGERVELFEYSR